jgi:tRNA(fMet)-specific endonuclease VapC
MPQSRFMLDTNTASFIIRRALPNVRKKFAAVAPSQICLSVITKAELLYGLARKPDAAQLKIAVHEFLLRSNILLWDDAAADMYGLLRAALEKKGKSIGIHDTMIAAHALAANAVLVTSDKAFRYVEGLATEDWTL